MIYTVRFEKQAQRFLKKADRFTANLLMEWIAKNLEDTKDPRIHGKGLTGVRSGEWSYRVGSYRIIAEIEDATETILVTTINRRGKAYR